MIHQAHVLDLIFLCVLIVAGCTIFSALPTRIEHYLRALASLASIFCSLIAGFLVFQLSEYYWSGIVHRLIR